MSFFSTNNNSNNTGFSFGVSANTAAPAATPVAPTATPAVPQPNTTNVPFSNPVNNTKSEDKQKKKDENKDKQPASLKQILERSKLTNSKILPQELPAIERGLDQIDSQSKKLSAMTASNDEGVNIRAHYFLAQGGVNTQVLIKELGTIHLGELERERQPIQDTNIEEYIEQQSTDTVMKIVQDERQEILNTTHDLFQKDIDNYWNDLLTNSLNVNNVKDTTLNLSKAKFDQSRIVSAGLI